MRRTVIVLCLALVIAITVTALKGSAHSGSTLGRLDGIWVGACPDCTVTGAQVADPYHPQACVLAQQGCSCANCMIWTLGGCTQQNCVCSATGGPNFTCHTVQTVCPGSETYKLCTDLCIGQYAICTKLFSSEREWMCSKQGSYTQGVECKKVPSQ